MSSFIDIWTNWSVYEKLSISLSWFAVFIILSLSVKLLTKNNRLTVIAMLALIASAFTTKIFLLFTVIVLNFEISELFMIIPMLVTTVNILSIGTFVGYYYKNHNRKDFDLKDIKKEYLSDTIKLTIITTLFFSAITIFTTGSILIVLSLAGLLSLLQLWINYYLMYKFIK